MLLCSHNRLLCIAFLILLVCLGHARGAFADGQLWEKQSIYQVITDRFFNGDPSNDNADGNYDPSGHTGTSVHGGDFKGLEKKLDYIQALGATAIWISPIVLNVRGEFHGYAGYDFTQIDPHWGTLADLRHFVDAAHARGLLVINDIVVNHADRLLDSADPGYPHFKKPPDGYNLHFRRPDRGVPAPFTLNPDCPTLTNLFHNHGFIESYDDPIEVQWGELHGLNDFRTENPYVRKMMQTIYEDWIEKAGFDGYRVDTVKHVEMGFWETWSPAIHQFAAKQGKPDFFMFGEVLSQSDRLCASYVGTNGGGPFKLDSALDYPLYFKTKNVFAKGTGKTSELADRYASLATHYDTAAQSRLVTFLDNHDQPRFLSTGQAGSHLSRLKTALVFLYTARGIPCLYYGTEQGFNGGNDPFDREDMFAGEFKDGPPGVDSFNLTHPLFLWVAQLNNFRRLYPALQTGSFSILFSDKEGPGLFAYARRLEAQEVLVVLNTSKTNQTLSACGTSYREGEVLANMLDAHETIAVQTGSRTPAISVPGESAKIFVAQSMLKHLDPVVIEMTPAHDARNVATNAPLEIHFSTAMETKSVEANFSISPKTTGKFSWSSNRDVLTYTPIKDGFPGDSIINVRIANVRDAAGQPMHAAFEAQFKTSNPSGLR